MEKKNLGTLVANLREQKKMTLIDLADAAKEAGFKRKVSTTFLSKVESGTTVPSLQVITALAKALGASLKTFVDQAKEDAVKLATERINQRYAAAK